MTSPLDTSSLPVDAIILAGPTASGKTEVLDETFGEGSSIWLPRLRDAWRADIHHVHIISADSMQAYRGMNIGTAKPSPELQRRLPHHLIDIKDPREQYTAGEFVARADQLCTELSARGVLPIVSGGTGFYILNFICGLPSAPPSSPEIRAEVAADLERLGVSALRAELGAADPTSAMRIHERDIYRLTRAVEILRASGAAPSKFAPKKEARAGRRFAVLGMTRERELLRVRIRARVNAMLASGLESEVHSLIAQGYMRNDPGMQAIGYKEFFEFEGRPIAEIADAIALHTSQYAKRQMTFFRALPDIAWIEPTPEALFGALMQMGCTASGVER